MAVSFVLALCAHGADGAAASPTDRGLEQQIRQLAEEITPELKALLPAGWTLDMSKVPIKVLSRRELAQDMSRYYPESGTGLKRFVGHAKRAVCTLLSAYSVGAAAVNTEEGTLIFVREELPTNGLRGLKSILAHEMTHIAVHQTLPRFGHEWRALSATAVEDVNESWARQLLFESHARWNQEVFEARYGRPEGRAAVRTALVLAGLELRSPLYRHTMASYTFGDDLRSFDIDRLYRDAGYRRAKLHPLLGELANRATPAPIKDLGRSVLHELGQQLRASRVGQSVRSLQNRRAAKGRRAGAVIKRLQGVWAEQRRREPHRTKERMKH